MYLPRIVRTLFLATIVSAIPAASYAEVAISVNIGPPALPVYEQPPCPADGYIWTPGYWAWGPDGYYWVPGTWVPAPAPGLLWTPGYWGWVTGVYVWHPGYWGPHVGFYGGVNYGYGYGGMGYLGGRWEGDHFRYNTSVTRVNVTVVHNVYVDRTVIVNRNVNHGSFNGGPGGIAARPNEFEMRAAQERHMAPAGAQLQHEQFARADRNQWASVNHGNPGVTAAPRPMNAGFHGNPTPMNNGQEHRDAQVPGGGAHPAFSNPQPQHQAAPTPQYNGQPQHQAPQYRPQQTPSPQSRPQQVQAPQYRPQQPQTPQYRPQQAPQRSQPQPSAPQNRQPQFEHQNAPAQHEDHHEDRHAPSGGHR
jgi:WXXGXW repeat (2 copies)